MSIRLKALILAAAMALGGAAAGAGLMGCDNHETHLERTGHDLKRDMKNTGEDLKDNLKDTGEKIKDKLEDTADEVKDAVD